MADIVHTEVKEVKVVESVVDVPGLAGLDGPADDFFGVVHGPVDVLEHEVGVVVLAFEEPADGFVDVVDDGPERLDVVVAVVGVPVGTVLLNVSLGEVEDGSEVAGLLDGLVDVGGLVVAEVERPEEVGGDVFAEVVHSVVEVPEGDEGNVGIVVEAGVVGSVGQVISDGSSPGDVV